MTELILRLFMIAFFLMFFVAFCKNVKEDTGSSLVSLLVGVVVHWVIWCGVDSLIWAVSRLYESTQ